MAEVKRKYQNPPLQEAVCEVRFDAPEPLTKERLERFKPVWAQDYPDQKLVEEMNVNIQMSPEGVKTDRQPTGHRLICKSTDGKRLVQVGSSFLAINQLRPYLGWEESFRDVIVQRAAIFIKSVPDIKFKRVGLRYINKIDIPEQPFVWEEWFQFKLPIPALPECRTSHFQMQFRNSLANGCRITINAITLLPPQTKKLSVILDLDVIWEGQPTAFESLAEILEKVHNPLGLAFEAYLTDKTRALFS